MRIFLVNTEYPREGSHGGIATYVYNSASVFSELGHKTFVLDKKKAPAEKLLSDIEFINYGRVKKIPRGLSAVLHRLFPAAARHIEYCAGLADALESAGATEKDSYVEIPDYLGEGIFLKHKGIRYFSKLHTPTFMLEKLNGHKDRYSFLFKMLERISVKNSSGVSSPSRSLARISESGFALNKPVHIIPYPLYRTGKTLRETRETTVLFAGRDEKRKGTGLIREFGFLLKQKAPEYVLKVCGEFGRQNGTKEGNIIFTGPLGSENLRTEYRRASVFLFLSSWDNFPNVVIEAMQNGCIVLSFKNGGAEEMIEDKKSGYLYDRNRLGEMAQKAVEIMKHPEDFENIRKNALTRIESVCDPAKFAKKTLEQVK